MSQGQADALPGSNPPIKKQADIFGGAYHGKAGLWVYLMTDGLTFGGLLLGYGILRIRNPEWPHPATYLGIGLSAVATFLLICSSVSMVFAQSAGEARKPRKMLHWLLATAFGGICFLGIQVYEYMHLAHSQGMSLADFAKGPPQFASTFFIVTGFHGAHVLTGVIYLLIMAARTAMGKYDNGDVRAVELCGLFWHFVDLVWILVFTLIYLL
jgi:heme/copper-type cytochrome/quinol oxidase subunit 3